MHQKTISGFSKLSKEEKLRWAAGNFFSHPEEAQKDFRSFWLSDEEQQHIFDGFSENTLSNFLLPYGVAPNFIINDRPYLVPMVIEESSVVAAASSAAKFWMSRGGFRAEVLATRKLGQVHFFWPGKAERLRQAADELRRELRSQSAELTANMEKRGGGVLDIELRDLTALEPDCYQLLVAFETCDSMGANFINSVLESYAQTLERFFATYPAFEASERQVSVIMAILSNYTPECLVRTWVECPITALGDECGPMPPALFAQRFYQAVRIAHIDPYRAATHNKGIFNGVDAVVLATGNDFRAVEAGGHTFAARDGQYRSLSSCSIDNGIFRFWMDLPLALGTVGGLTRLHPLAHRSLDMLGHPTAPELMMIIAATGLAQNFAAVRSLVTTGIQQGHMKMHLGNILHHLGATELEKPQVVAHFQDRVVSYTAVREFLENLRKVKVC